MSEKVSRRTQSEAYELVQSMKERFALLEDLFRQVSNGSVMLAVNLNEEWPEDDAIQEACEELLAMGTKVREMYERFPDITAQLY